MQLTTLIIASNEEDTISRAVLSAIPLGNVIVVDGGSTDRTVAAAQEAGADVIENSWPGFAAQRRFALERCETEWALFLDADEEITEPLSQEIAALDPQCDGYRIRRKNLFLGRWMEHGAWGRDRVLRLFRLDRAEVPDRAVHEEVKISGTVGELDAPLLHYAQNDFGTVGEKFASYIPLMAQEIVGRKKQISMPAVFLRAKWSFFRDLFLRRGFLDGWRGFVLAFWGAASIVAKYAEAKRLMEKKNQPTPPK